MRRFLLLVFLSCAAASAALALMPRQLAGYLVLFERHTQVNSGVAVTVLAVVTLALVALRVRLWRSERDLARLRRGLAQPAAPAYPVYPPYPVSPVSSWGSRPAR
jgi:hypothetical protein